MRLCVFRGGGSPRGFPAELLDRRGQTVEIDRLAEDGLGRHVPGREGGEDDHGNPVELPEPALLFEKLPPVHDGHHQIQKDQAGRDFAPFEGTQRISSVGQTRDSIAGVGQDLGEHLSQLDVVLDDEDIDGRGHASSTGP